MEWVLAEGIIECLCQRGRLTRRWLVLSKVHDNLNFFLGFNGFFFYSDGNYQLLERLTGGRGIPSLVIVDPF